MKLPTVEEARARMLAQVVPLPAEAVAVREADGRWLMQAVTATRDQPPFDASAMDGWAVRSADVETATVLTIIGQSAAGHGADVAVGPGQTVRIFTGAPVPEGADRVVIQEEAERRGGELSCGPTVSSARHIRARGCDFREGEILLNAGDRLNPWRLALAASAGAGVLRCGSRPRVAVMATGDELVEAGAPAGPSQIYNSAAPALEAFIVRHGGEAVQLPVAGDTTASIIACIDAARFDILVTVGGASVGEHDLVKPALKGEGAILHVESVAVRPGKPVWFAILPDGRPVLGLPGNPASALVCAELFLAPILARLQGGVVEDRFETALLTADLPANGDRDHYIRAHAVAGPDGRRLVTPFDNQDSSLVTVMAAANALIRRPTWCPAAAAGSVVRMIEAVF